MTFGDWTQRPELVTAPCWFYEVEDIIVASVLWHAGKWHAHIWNKPRASGAFALLGSAKVAVIETLKGRAAA